MMIKWMKIAAIVVSSVSLAGSASADLIAGWDFSQYKVDGSLDAGAGPVDTLPANYSSLDATYGAGGTSPGDSADFGTMFIDGSNGSTNVTEGAASPGPEVVAHANDTRQNRLGPALTYGAQLPNGFVLGTLPIQVFDAFTVLAAEGQTNTSRSALTARSAVDVVFEADMGVIDTRTWELSFAGFAIDPTGSVDVDVEVAPSCGAYTAVQTVTLTATEGRFYMPLVNVNDDNICVRLRLDPTNGQPVIDNVAVPEPGMVSMLVAGVLGLVGLERRRRA